MTWVITAQCDNRKLARCLEHCPVPNCIFTSELDSQFYIDPNLCTDCGECDLSCPVAAIFPAFALPEYLEHYEALNASAAQRVKGATAIE